MPFLAVLQQISNSVGFHVDIHTGALLFGLIWARILAALSLIPFWVDLRCPDKSRSA
jgi:hypothetical protein